ncbi:hypothetical protein Syun_025938 [Stephania yunnanensis]|uniref:Uncharacterized protein n=1 Tax=Stephania yunnanensis TaxID=152371 RepID=A0AAP0HRR1_9MAGN
MRSATSQTYGSAAVDREPRIRGFVSNATRKGGRSGGCGERSHQLKATEITLQPIKKVFRIVKFLGSKLLSNRYALRRLHAPRLLPVSPAALPYHQLARSRATPDAIVIAPAPTNWASSSLGLRGPRVNPHKINTCLVRLHI